VFCSESIFDTIFVKCIRDLPAINGSFAILHNFWDNKIIIRGEITLASVIVTEYSMLATCFILAALHQLNRNYTAIFLNFQYRFVRLAAEHVSNLALLVSHISTF